MSNINIKEEILELVDSRIRELEQSMSKEGMLLHIIATLILEVNKSPFIIESIDLNYESETEINFMVKDKVT